MPTATVTRTIGRPPWRLSYQATLKDEKVIPEPRHRVGPKGVSSGISLREFPNSCIEQVKNICLHYVDKCSGQYENNQAAGRYVHQMADEIIQQLETVSAKIKWHEEEPEIYENLLKEWKNYFPSSLGAIGSPQAISDKVANQNQEIERLKFQLNNVETIQKRNTEEKLNSLHVQLHSAKLSTLQERNIAFKFQQDMKMNFEENIKIEREENEKQKNDLIARMNEEIQSLKISYEEKTNTLHRELQTIQQEYNNFRRNSESTIKSMKKKFDNEMAQLKKHYDLSQRELKSNKLEIQTLMNLDDQLYNEETPKHFDYNSNETETEYKELGGELKASMPLMDQPHSLGKPAAKKRVSKEVIRSNKLDTPDNSSIILLDKSSDSCLTKYRQKMKNLQEKLSQTASEKITLEKELDRINQENIYLIRF